MPRVYLTAATISQTSRHGAQITGATVNIDVDQLNNSGEIYGADSLTVHADSADNRGGSLRSASDLAVYVLPETNEAGEVLSDGAGIFTNSSGTVSGNNVLIKANQIINNTKKIRDHFSRNNYADRIQQIASIQADGDLSLLAGKIYSEGGQFSAGGKLNLDALGDIAITPLVLDENVRAEFDGGHYHRQSSTNHLASLEAGGDINLESGKDILLRGVQGSAGEDITITAENDVQVLAVQDSHSEDLKTSSKESGIFGSSSSEKREQSSTLRNQSSSLEYGGNLSITAKKGDVTLKATEFSGPTKAKISAVEGQVSLLTTKDSDSYQKEESSENAIWQKASGEGHYQETVNHVTSTSGFTIIAGEGVVVEYENTGDLNSSIDQLAQNPNLAWMAELKDNPDVNWQAVTAKSETWDYETQGLTEAGAALLTIAVAAATSGTLSSASANLATSLGFSASGPVQAALFAGMNSLTQRASIAIVNNQGDIGAALDELGSSQAVDSLLTSMITAGLTNQIADVTGIGSQLPADAPLGQRLLNDLPQATTNAVTAAAVSTAIQGGDFDENLRANLRSEAAGIIGKNIAQDIGAAARAPGSKMNTAWQLIAHTALGCATGAVANDDCRSGALGAAVGEATALVWKASTNPEQLATELGQAVASGELSFDEAEALVYKWQQQGVNLAKLAAGLTAALADADVNTAAEAGATSAENNALPIIPLLMIAGAAWTAYDTIITYQEEGGEAALRQLAIDGTITMFLGAGGKVAFKVGGKVFKSAPKAWQEVKELGLYKSVFGPKPMIGNPFRGRTPEQIDKIYRDREFIISGKDKPKSKTMPDEFKRGYANPGKGV